MMPEARAWGGPPWTGAETAVVVGSGLVPGSSIFGVLPRIFPGRTPSTYPSGFLQCSPTRVEIKHMQLDNRLGNCTEFELPPSWLKRRLICREGLAKSALSPLPVKRPYRGGAPRYRGGAPRTHPGAICLSLACETI